MPDLSALFIFPVVTGAIVVVFEYFVVQPIKKSTERAVPSSPSISRDWASAMRKGIAQFRAQYYGSIGQWAPRPHENITVDEWNIAKGRATLILSVNRMVVTYEPGILDFYRIPRVIAKHRLSVDRTGDVLESKALPIEQTSAEQTFGTTPQQFRETTLSIKSRKPPRTERAQNGVNVIIEFEVENLGRPGKVCPYIEFQVITSRLDGKYSPKIYNTKSMAFDIPGYCTMPIKLTFFFESPQIPLVQSPNEVKIELRPCRDARS